MRNHSLSPRLAALITLIVLSCALPARARSSQAPDWMHALVNVPVPAHDEKDNAVLLYREETLTVVNTDKFRRTVREAYKILRPEGRRYGLQGVDFNSLSEKVTSIKGWCIPASGKDYEVTEKDAIEASPTKDQTFVLMSDEKVKVIEIPAPDPGNIVGYEYVKEEKPYILQDSWDFQEAIPVRESHYSLVLPDGWEYKDAWTNYSEVKVQNAGGGQWRWSIGDVQRIRREEDMPAFRAVAGRMVLTLYPPGGASAKTLPTWHDVGEWELRLTNGRTEASPEIKQQVQTLTASASASVAKMQAIAKFVQNDIRYVAIELGIGGWQPHPAADVFTHHYGDCKDKATLMKAMLHEIGVESYYVDVNTARGSVTPATPAEEFIFNHAIIAVRIPDSVNDPSLIATIKHPTLGTILFFDPTNQKTPFGEIGGYLQANYGLLVTPTGGELVELPQQPSHKNGIQRTGKLKLSIDGILVGDVKEVRVGDRAWASREAFTTTTKADDRIKPVEQLLADSVATFKIGHATVDNPTETSLPFVWNYSFQANDYAKYAGNLLLVRPRVLGKKGSGILETSEPRRFPIEFEGPVLDTDDFEITLPPNYAVDDLPPAVDADFGFASYHSKTEVIGNVLKYHRTFEEKQLSVPVSEAPKLKQFYRIIASDERNTAVLHLAR